MTVAQELAKLERHATAVLAAMPELKEADETLKGVEKLEAIKAIGTKYGLDGLA